jgi:hypothetical protein
MLQAIAGTMSGGSRDWAEPSSLRRSVRNSAQCIGAPKISMMTSDYVLGVIAQFEKTSLVAMKSGARSQEGRCGQMLWPPIVF